MNVNFSDPGAVDFVPLYRGTFFCFSGALALGLFIHNCVITITGRNRHPENSIRDVVVAFLLVLFTYLFIGFVFYITFPLPKSCISDVSIESAVAIGAV